MDAVTASEPLLLVEQRGPVRWLTLNRPTKANALTIAMMQQVVVELSQAERSADVTATVLTGAGERVFTAGVDTREKPSDGDAARHRERRSHALASLQDAVLASPKPVIAALNGAAIGGGAMIALLADACIGGETADIGLPEIDIGIPTFSGASILAVIGGRALALDLVQSGRRMSAREACGRGLLRAVTSQAGLPDAAALLAGELGGKDHSVFAANKRWINRALRSALAEAREEHARHRAKAAG